MSGGLSGRRVVVTRARHQAATMIAGLTQRGAIPIPFPTVAIAPVDDCGPLDRALTQFDTYDWVVLTSANGAEIFCDRLATCGIAVPWGDRPAVAAVGPATGEALTARGITPAHIPATFVGDRIPDDLPLNPGARVLWPRAAAARSDLADRLRARGAAVEDVVTYHTVAAQPDPEALTALDRGVDVVTFTSGSTVRHFLEIAGPDPTAGATVACIGPVTAAAARQHGLRVDLVADVHTTEGMLDALDDYLSRQSPQRPHPTRD